MLFDQTNIYVNVYAPIFSSFALQLLISIPIKSNLAEGYRKEKVSTMW